MFPMMKQRRFSDEVDFDVEPRTEADRNLRDALKAKMLEIIGGDFTSRALVELEQFAQLGRALLVVGRVPTPKTPGDFGLNAATINGDVMGSSFAYSPPAETFGATLVRELVAAVGRMTDKREPTDLVKAIGVARELKLDDIAAKLEASLVDADAPNGAQVPDLASPSAGTESNGTPFFVE